MTLDEQILIAKDEKIFNENVKLLMEEIDNIKNETEEPGEEMLINMAYSDAGEQLTDYDYDGALENLKQKDVVTTLEAIQLGRICSYTLKQLSESRQNYYRAISEIRGTVNIALTEAKTSKDPQVVYEAYYKLAKIQTLLEATVGYAKGKVDKDGKYTVTQIEDGKRNTYQFKAGDLKPGDTNKKDFLVKSESLKESKKTEVEKIEKKEEKGKKKNNRDLQLNIK